MPDRVLLQPAPLEYGLHGEQYDALVEDLEAEGVLVRVVPPVEERRVPWGMEPADFYDVVILVGETAAAILSTAKLVAIVRRRLRGRRERRRAPRRAKIIYLASGEEHVVPLDDEDE